MEHIVLIIDDDKTSLKLASGIIGEDYRTALAISGEKAMSYLENHIPDLILLDINMPGMTGYEVMKQIQENPKYSEIPVIFVAADSSAQTEAHCLEMGAIDYVSKPFIPMVLKNRVKRVIELYDYRKNLEGMVAEQAEEIIEKNDRISDIQNEVIVGIANLIEERDNSTGEHAKSTQHYVNMICHALRDNGVYEDEITDEFIRNMTDAAPLHDVGKIKISDTILQKTGKLSEDEYKIMQNHSRYGADIIEDILGGVENPAYLDLARDVALYHHERWDGNGYPEGLYGEEIPLGARIMAVADVFDALHEDRVYHRGLDSVDDVFAIMKESSGTQFDPEIIRVFLTLKDQIEDHLEEKDKSSI